MSESDQAVAKEQLFASLYSELRRLAQRESRGMRHDWSHVKGLTTIVRVLPPDLYDKVMHGDDPLAPGSSIFGPAPKRRKMS